MAKCYLCQKDNIPFMGGFTMNGIPGKICNTCREEYLKIASSKSDGKYFSDILNSTKNHPATDTLIKIIQDANGEINKEIDSLPVSTTDFLDGYSIIEYKNVVTGISVFGTAIFHEFEAKLTDSLGLTSLSAETKISAAKTAALYQLKRDAYLQSCNAVIGVSMNFAPLNGSMIGVLASGTAVVTSKNAEQ
ncbi:MAG: YbjQ family protein [Lachnospiraceae bacterium]|nr:YbjQ family protein [Lachnospiraceae bacterium]